MGRTQRNLALLLMGIVLPLLLSEESYGQWFSFSRAQARQRKCIHLYESGDYPDARECIQQFLSDYPDSRWSESLYFLDAKLETNVSTAAEKYDWFLRTYPNGQFTPEAAFLLGELYELTGDFPGAQEAYMHVYLYFPGSRFSSEAGLRGAKCMVLNDDALSALNHLEEYLLMHPDYPWKSRAKELHADILYQRGEYERAQEEYRQVISEIPPGVSSIPRCYLQVARIYDLTGDLEAALQCYRQFVKTFPDSELTRTADERIQELSSILHVSFSEEVPSHSVEAGSFSSESDATALVARLKELGYQAHIENTERPEKPFSVQLGPYKTRELADTIAERLRNEAVPDALVLSGDGAERETSVE